MDAQVGAAIVSLQDEELTVPFVRVVLSERNLRTLLLTLDEENNDVTRLIPEIGMMLIIASETNEVHYKDREAGLMNEDVELKLAEEELSSQETLFIPPDFLEDNTE